MDIERFEEVLRAKVDSGIDVFTGKATHNVYDVSNPTGQVRGWRLFKNGHVVMTNARFTQVAWAIWDYEMEAR